MATTFTQEEWSELAAAWPRGASVRGRVVGRQPFGVFIDVEELRGVVALLELFYFDIFNREPDRRLDFPADYASPGDPIEAKVPGWSPEPKEVRLTQLESIARTDLRRS